MRSLVFLVVICFVAVNTVQSNNYEKVLKGLSLKSLVHNVQGVDVSAAEIRRGRVKVESLLHELEKKAKPKKTKSKKGGHTCDGCGHSSYDPSSDYGYSSYDPSSDYGYSSYDPSSDYGYSSYDPSSDYGYSSYDPSSDYGYSSYDPSSDYGYSSYDPSSSYGYSSYDPSSDYGYSSYDPSYDYGYSSYDSSSDYGYSSYYPSSDYGYSSYDSSSDYGYSSYDPSSSYGSSYADRVYPDETAPAGAVSSGSSLFTDTANGEAPEELNMLRRLTDTMRRRLNKHKTQHARDEIYSSQNKKLH